jgi:dTDP-4-amino-4,6-dideoxygalactose transaminase
LKPEKKGGKGQHPCSHCCFKRIHTEKEDEMQVPFADLKAQYHAIRQEIDSAMAAVIAESAFIGGKYAGVFEEAFAAFCGVKYCVGVGNGTDALHIALRSLGVGPGDEVITAANTFIATAEAITMTGARVVFVDCDPATYNIDVRKVPAAITPRTKAIIPVHLYGQPADMTELTKIAREQDLLLVEDAAQAHGAEIGGRRVGTFGRLACFSFYPGKNLGAYGDAGAIVTSDEALAVRCRMIANHGRIRKYDHDFEGINSRLDGLQGAILHVKLGHLEAWTERRRSRAALYDELLKGSGVVTPVAAPGTRHVYHLYVVRVPNRDSVQTELKEAGIATGVHYPIALPSLAAYRYLGHRPEDFPVANRYAGKIISLPMFPEMTDEQVAYVCDLLRRAVRGEEAL